MKKYLAAAAALSLSVVTITPGNAGAHESVSSEAPPKSVVSADKLNDDGSIRDRAKLTEDEFEAMNSQLTCFAYAIIDTNASGIIARGHAAGHGCNDDHEICVALYNSFTEYLVDGWECGDPGDPQTSLVSYTCSDPNCAYAHARLWDAQSGDLLDEYLSYDQTCP